MRFQALFIDVDGTAVQSEPLIYNIVNDMVQRGGYQLTNENWQYLFENNGDDYLWEIVCDWHPAFKDSYPSAQAFEDAYVQQVQNKAHKADVQQPVLNVVKQFLENAQDVAAVSNSLTVVIEALLETAGYPIDDFSHVVGKDFILSQGRNKKPAPDPYLYTLDRINDFRDGEGKAPLSPSDCLVIEDTKTGVRSALKAGMTVIQILEDKDAIDMDEAMDLMHDHGGQYYSCRLDELEDLVEKLNPPPHKPFHPKLVHP